jgi:hypothetical protein
MNMPNAEKAIADLIQNIVADAKSPEAARNALAQLFPKTERVIRTFVPDHYAGRNYRKRQRRLSEREFASAYFRLDPQPASWSKVEIDEVLNALDPAKALDDAKEKLNAEPEDARPRLRRLLLEALDGAFSVTRPFNFNWFKALLERAPYFVAADDESRIFLYTFDNADRLRWVLIHALTTLLPDARANLVTMAIPQVEDISMLCDMFRAIARDLHEEGAKDQLQEAGFANSTDVIRQSLLGRVRMLANSNQLWSQSQPDRILWFWWGSSAESEVRAFTRRTMETEVGIRGLLRVTVSLVHSTQGDYAHVGISSWSRIVDLDDLARRATAIEVRDNDSDRALARRFLDALERGKTSPI